MSAEPSEREPDEADAPLREEDVTLSDRLDDRVAEGEDLPDPPEGDSGN